MSSLAYSSGDLTAPVRKPPAERRVRDEADAELPHGGQHLLLHVALEDGVLGLQRGDRLHGVGAADRLRPRFAQAEVADLARVDELPHGPVTSSIGTSGSTRCW